MLMFLKVPAMLSGVNRRTSAEVGRLIRARRRTLGMTEGDLQAAAGIDSKTLKALEAGTRSPQEKTQLKIEGVLRWEPGAIESLREGGVARELPELSDTPPPTVSASDLTDDELLAEIGRRMKGGRRGLESDETTRAPGQAVETQEDEFDEQDLALPPPEIRHVPETTTVMPDLLEDAEDTGGFRGGPGAGRDVHEDRPDAAADG